MPSMTARRLVLDLVTARPEAELSIAALCRAAEVVGLSEASVRMAATRLAEEGSLTRVDRGTYRLDPSGLPTFDPVSTWRTRLESMVEWQGCWMVADAAAVPRSDRTAQKRLATALGVHGFVLWQGTLHVRPDNLVGGVAAMRPRLPDALTLFAAGGMALEDDAAVRGLWTPALLHDAHRAMRHELAESLRHEAEHGPEVFAGQALGLGSRAIAQIVRDPLLPDELDDHEELRLLTEQTVEYQVRALAVWEQLLRPL